MMKYTSLYLLIALLGLSQLGIAQDEILPERRPLPRYAIKFSPLPLIDFTPAIQIGAEAATFDHQSVAAEYGFVTPINKNSRFQGFKLKGEYRFYKRGLNHVGGQPFWGLQYMFKQVLTPQKGFLWSEDQTYQMKSNYEIQNRTNSFFLIGGFMHDIAKGPIFFEYVIGLGYRRLDISGRDVPEGFTLDRVNFSGSFQSASIGLNNLLGMFLSFKVAVRIK